MQAKIAAFLDGVDLSEEEEEPEKDDDEPLKELSIPADLPDDCLDHVVLGCSDIRAGRKVFEELTGLKTGIITSLCGGAGTKSVLVALNDNKFLEIVAPDGKTSEGAAGDLQKIEPGKLQAFHYSVRRKPENIKVPDSSWQIDNITIVGTGSPEEFAESGEVLKWDLVHIYGHGVGGTVPSFVSWKDNRSHPSARLDKTEGKLKRVDVRAPEGHHVHEMVKGVEGIKIKAGKPKLVVEIETPKGAVKFTGKTPAGMCMPGFNDETHESYNK